MEWSPRWQWRMSSNDQQYFYSSTSFLGPCCTILIPSAAVWNWQCETQGPRARAFNGASLAQLSSSSHDSTHRQNLSCCNLCPGNLLWGVFDNFSPFPSMGRIRRRRMEDPFNLQLTHIDSNTFALPVFDPGSLRRVQNNFGSGFGWKSGLQKTRTSRCTYVKMTENLSRYLTSWQITIEATTYVILDAFLVCLATFQAICTALNTKPFPSLDVSLLVGLCQVVAYHCPTSHDMVVQYCMRRTLRLLADNWLEWSKPTLYSPDTACRWCLFLLYVHKQHLCNMYVFAHVCATWHWNNMSRRVPSLTEFCVLPEGTDRRLFMSHPVFLQSQEFFALQQP